MKTNPLHWLAFALVLAAPVRSQTAATQAPASAASAPAQAGANPAPAPSAFTNEDVVKLSQLGMSGDVIVAKINTAQQVAFKVETDDLVALKKAGVSQDVIAAVVKRSSSPVAMQGAGGAGGLVDTPMGTVRVLGTSDMLVRLVTKEKTIDLTSVAGNLSSHWAYVTTLTFMNYPNQKAEVRTTDHKPYILIQSQKSPQGRLFLVHCESDKDDNDRSVKVGKAGLYSSSGMGIPDSDSDWTVPVEVKAVQPGLWRIDPKGALDPGEYGVYGPGGELYDFGLDK